ncbi:hypothetical protein [Pseudomonas sp.]|uniref:hypothetical protein n=1 Tax=Pseudomonas sp. TaxID=306 RepID=UPI003566AABD
MSNVDTIVLQSLVERLFANAGASPEVAGTVARVERGATSNAPLGRGGSWRAGSAVTGVNIEVSIPKRKIRCNLWRRRGA